nr:response regulator transcription factor [Desulfobacterales bacterium]
MKSNLIDKKTILLVDDHTLFRKGLRVLLKESPIFVVVGEAGTVCEASKKAHELKPDLVLMDIALPDRSGIEGARIILSQVPSVKVVVISMYSKLDFVIKALQAGGVGYLVKDTTPDMLLEALTTVIRGHYYFDHTILDEIVQFLLEHGQEEKSISDEKYERLTPREQEIMRLVAQGLSTKQIASKLFISPKTVENHRTKIMEKLQLDNLISLVKYAAKLGIIDIQS